MAENELTIVTRFRAEVDEQNRALASTSTQLTALAKQLDSSVEGFDRFRSTVDGAVDRLKLFGIRGQRMADAINKGIHDPIKRAQAATRLFNLEQGRTHGIMDKAEGAFRKVGMELGIFRAKLGALAGPLAAVAAAALGASAAIGKKLLDATVKFIKASPEHRNHLELLNEELARFEKSAIKSAMGTDDFKGALEELTAVIATVRSSMEFLSDLGFDLPGTLSAVLPFGPLIGMLRTVKRLLDGIARANTNITGEQGSLLEQLLGTIGGRAKPLAPGEKSPRQRKVSREELARLKKERGVERHDAERKAQEKANADREKAQEKADAKLHAEYVREDKARFAARKAAWKKQRKAELGHLNWLRQQAIAKFKIRQKSIKDTIDLTKEASKSFREQQKEQLEVLRTRSEAAIDNFKKMSEVADAKAFAGFFGWEPDFGTLEKLQSQIDTLKDSFVGLGSAVGQAFGAMIVGEMGLKDFGNMMLAQLGSMAINWGSFFMLLGAGLSYFGGAGAALIGIGFGLTVLGGALTALSQRGGNQPKGAGGGGGAAAFDPASMARDISPKRDERRETVVQVFVAGDQIRDPIWRTVNEGIRTNRIPLGV